MSDPYELHTPFKQRYYRRKDKKDSADRVARLLRLGTTFNECGHLAIRVCGVHPAEVRKILCTTQPNAVRMMNLAKACRRAIRARTTAVAWPPGL